MAQDGAVEVRCQLQFVPLRQQVAQRTERWIFVPAVINTMFTMDVGVQTPQHLLAAADTP